MHPILLDVSTAAGHIRLPAYGAMLSLSLTLGAIFVLWVGPRREGWRREHIRRLYLGTGLGALVGARLLYVLTNLEQMSGLGSMLDYRLGGLVAYGGFLGGVAGAGIVARRARVSLLAWADVAAPALGLGLCLTRVGCYLFGCDFGRPLSSAAPAWLREAGTFPRWQLFEGMSGSPALMHHIRTLGLPADATHSLPVHPTQLYESALGLALLVAAWVVLQRRTWRGAALVTVAAGYAVGRYMLEILRDDPGRGALAGLSTSQLISIGVLVAAGVLAIRQRRRAPSAVRAATIDEQRA